MQRDKLYEAIGKVVQGRGFNMFTGFEHGIGGVGLKYPAVWLTPFNLVGLEGRREGFVTYRVEMHIIRVALKVNPQIKEQIWAEMEAEAAEIIAAVGEDRDITNVEKIAMEPAEYTLTAGGELSMKVRFDARLHFLKN